jgi:predicted SAM-dependent methyltransferase
MKLWEYLFRSSALNLNNIINYLGRSKHINADSNSPKINIGCGLEVAPGWINIDSSPTFLISFLPKIFIDRLYYLTDAKNWYSQEQFTYILKNNKFIHYDVKYGLPFKDVSIKYIYASHMLEHMYKNNAIYFLKEANRVLKPGGILRLIVPDLSFIIDLYLNGNKERALSFFFSENSFTPHRFMYDFESLKEQLIVANFREIVHCSFKEGRVPDIDLLDNRPGESLYVEAIK